MVVPNEGFYLQVGRRIQAQRGRKHMTQADLGQRLRPPVTRASIANLESGKQRVLLHTFMQIVEILECKLTDLLPDSPLSIRQGNAGSEVASELAEKVQIPNRTLQRIERELKAQTSKGRT